MLQWRVILLAALAVLLLVAGLVALILPDPYEGGVLYELDEQHTFRFLDGIALGLLVLGCAVAWAAGWIWHRRMYGS
jgi:hypothetical protein